MKPTASFPIRKNGNSMKISARTGRREPISSLHRIGVVMCRLISETLEELAVSATFLRVSSEEPAEAPAGDKRDLQHAGATWKPRSVSPLQRRTAAQAGPLLSVAPTESRSRYVSTFRPARPTENSSTFPMKANLEP